MKFTLLLILMITYPAFSKSIYQCKLEDGRIIFQDTSCKGVTIKAREVKPKAAGSEQFVIEGTWVSKEVSLSLDGDRYPHKQKFVFKANGKVETMGSSFDYTFNGAEIKISSPVPAKYKILKIEGKKAIWESYAGGSKTGYFFINKQ